MTRHFTQAELDEQFAHPPVKPRIINEEKWPLDLPISRTADAKIIALKTFVSKVDFLRSWVRSTGLLLDGPAPTDQRIQYILMALMGNATISTEQLFDLLTWMTKSVRHPTDPRFSVEPPITEPLEHHSVSRGS
jgi:hypothetical protein